MSFSSCQSFQPGSQTLNRDSVALQTALIIQFAQRVHSAIEDSIALHHIQANQTHQKVAIPIFFYLHILICKLDEPIPFADLVAVDQKKDPVIQRNHFCSFVYVAHTFTHLLIGHALQLIVGRSVLVLPNEGAGVMPRLVIAKLVDKQQPISLIGWLFGINIFQTFQVT